MKGSEKYADIFRMPHHVSETRPQMPLMARAAQFAPFAALTGYEDEVAETARLTDTELELDETRKAEIDEQLQYLQQHIEERPEVEIVHFVPDDRKAGGAYVTTTGKVNRLDPYTRQVILKSGKKIEIDRIYAIQIEGRRGENHDN